MVVPLCISSASLATLSAVMEHSPMLSLLALLGAVRAFVLCPSAAGLLCIAACPMLELLPSYQRELRGGVGDQYLLNFGPGLTRLELEG